MIYEKYRFVHPNSVLFLNGPPLSGKSTLAPELAHHIDNCIVQHMDVLHLVSQYVEEQKPLSERNEFLFYGSTDAYKLIDDGSYSEEHLLAGFKKYSAGVAQFIFSILDDLNPENIDNMVVEGVQIMPELVAEYLKRAGYALLLMVTSPDQFDQNRDNVFSDEQTKQKYPDTMLLSLQRELISQTRELPEEKYCIIENTGNLELMVCKVIIFLLENKIITEV
jgi:2-phosphoglycerate kinase